MGARDSRRVLAERGARPGEGARSDRATRYGGDACPLTRVDDWALSRSNLRSAAGGMGEVYRALDTKLNRPVAIKVLPEALASDPERLKRFEQEARAASALDHPNIITIHDITEAEGIHFIVMQYVEGKTLRELLREGPLELEQNTGLCRPDCRRSFTCSRQRDRPS